jgi:hypothetical protein
VLTGLPSQDPGAIRIYVDELGGKLSTQLWSTLARLYQLPDNELSPSRHGTSVKALLAQAQLSQKHTGFG